MREKRGKKKALTSQNYTVVVRQDKTYLGYNLNEFTSSRNGKK